MMAKTLAGTFEENKTHKFKTNWDFIWGGKMQSNKQKAKHFREDFGE